MIQKRKEKERQETAKSSKVWFKPGTRRKTQERTHNSDIESVTPERAVEISQATTEKQEALEATLDTDDKDDQEITVSAEEEDATGGETVIMLSLRKQ